MTHMAYKPFLLLPTCLYVLQCHNLISLLLKRNCTQSTQGRVMVPLDCPSPSKAYSPIHATLLPPNCVALTWETSRYRGTHELPHVTVLEPGRPITRPKHGHVGRGGVKEVWQGAIFLGWALLGGTGTLHNFVICVIIQHSNNIIINAHIILLYSYRKLGGCQLSSGKYEAFLHCVTLQINIFFNIFVLNIIHKDKNKTLFAQ